jgi:hypothetical protein
MILQLKQIISKQFQSRDEKEYHFEIFLIFHTPSEVLF